MSALDTIAEAAQAAPPELPRLTTGDVFVNYSQMAKLVEGLVDSFKALPQASQKECGYNLTQILQACENIAKKAKRLLEANA